MKPKRTHLILITLFILISSACQKTDDTPSCSYIKNAKLKRIVACNYVESECPSKECDDINWIVEEYEYDNMGRIKKVLFGPDYEDGVLTNQPGYDLYKYNSKNQLINIEHYIRFRDDYMHYRNLIYTYSEDGKKIKEYTEWIDAEFQYKVFLYTNDTLKRIEQYKLDSDELEYYILNEYDSSGNLVKEILYDTNDKRINTYLHEYEDGNNVRSYKHGSEYLKTYDENNNLVSVKSIHPVGSSKMGGTRKYEYYD